MINKDISRKKPANRTSLSVILPLATALGSSVAFSQTAPAPSADSSDSIITMEAFSVTGSNIKRTDQEKVLPVTVMNFEAIQARDAATPSDMLVALPQITNIPNNETSVNAVAARGGVATVALRGLGAGNTLVLLNGRRSPFHPFNTQSVNVNTMPSFGVQQVEVLRDGASAIYGSDAVAGVINYITKKDPTGTEISVRFGVNEHGGGADYSFNLGHGRTFADGKGSLLTGFTAYDRDYIWWREREVSKTGDKIGSARAPFNTVGSAYDRLTQTGKWVQFRVGEDTITGTVNRVFPINGTPTITTAALPREYYADYNDYTVGQPRSRRYNLFNRMEYQLTDTIRAFGELGFYYAYSNTHRQPITLSSTDSRVSLSADNPYNPRGSRFYSPTGAPNSDGTQRLVGTPTPITITAMTLDDGGIEDVFARDSVWRGVAGLSGSFGESSWTWESALMYGRVDTKDYVFNAVRDSKLDDAAHRTNADTAWNPFGMTFKVENGAVVYNAPHTNSESVRNSYTETLTRFGESQIFSADFRANGEVAEIWAGKISASTGLEFRREYRADWRPPYHNFIPAGATNARGEELNSNNNDFLVTSPKGNLFASREIMSAYAETVVPLVATDSNLPLVYSLEANASVRYEDYSDFGETTKPKFGLNYKPTSWSMLRASLNKGFSAPQLDALYQPASFAVSTPPGVRDGVRNDHFQSAGRPVDGQVLIKTYTLSNANLQPEESDGLSVGIAIDVPFVRGLSFTVDYWEIEQRNLIEAKGRNTSLDEQMIRAYTQEQLAKGIPIDQIDTGFRITPDGPNTYVGDPNTLRQPVNDNDRALFAAANALLPASQQMAAVGVYEGIVNQNINLSGKNFTNGIDYNLSYNLPNTSLGQFRISTEWSQFLNKFTKDTPTSPKDDDLKAMGTAEWKSNTTLQWRKNDWSGSISAVWTSDIRTGATTTKAIYESLGRPSYIKEILNDGTTTYYEEGYDALQVNVGLSYRFQNDANKWLAGTTVRLGINNILDEEPSLAATASGYNGNTGSSLWVGRAYSLSLTRQF